MWTSRCLEHDYLCLFLSLCHRWGKVILVCQYGMISWAGSGPWQGKNCAVRPFAAALWPSGKLETTTQYLIQIQAFLHTRRDSRTHPAVSFYAVASAVSSDGWRLIICVAIVRLLFFFLYLLIIDYMLNALVGTLRNFWEVKGMILRPRIFIFLLEILGLQRIINS